MSNANFTFLSTTWVGDLCQKLESICNEVDDVVSQGTLRYVEDHVKSVSENVKTFCYSAVQDILHTPLNCPSEHAKPVPSHCSLIISNDGNQEYSSAADSKQFPSNMHSYQNSIISKDENEECPSCVDAEQLACQVDTANTTDNETSFEPYSSDYHLEEEPNILSLDDATTISTGVSLRQEEGSFINDVNDDEGDIEYKGPPASEVLDLDYLHMEPCEASSSNGSINDDASFNGHSSHHPINDFRPNPPKQEAMPETTSDHDSDTSSTFPTAQPVTSVVSCESNIPERELASSTTSISAELCRQFESSPANLVTRGEQCSELECLNERKSLPRRETMHDDGASDDVFGEDASFNGHLSRLPINDCGSNPQKQEAMHETTSNHDSDTSSTFPAAQPVTSVVSHESNIPETELASSTTSISAELCRQFESSPANLVTRGEQGSALECLNERKSLPRRETIHDDRASDDIFDASSSLCGSQLAISVTSCEINTMDIKLKTSSNSVLTELKHRESLPVNLHRVGDELCSDVANLNDPSTYLPAALPSFGRAGELPLIYCKNNDKNHGSFSCSPSTELSGEMNDPSNKMKDPEMETLELQSKTSKFNRSCLLGVPNANLAIRRKALDFSWYKKTLRHALTSRKRIEKDYKQLAIWYGDIDTDFNLLTKQNLQPVIVVPDSSNSTTQDTQDCEWVLL